MGESVPLAPNTVCISCLCHFARIGRTSGEQTRAELGEERETDKVCLFVCFSAGKGPTARERIDQVAKTNWTN